MTDFIWDFFYTLKAPLKSAVLFWYDRVYKPGSVLTAIYLDLKLLSGSSRLLEAVGPTCMLLHGVAPDRVYSTPMFPWSGWSLTPPFHPYVVDSRIQTLTLLQAVKLALYAESPLPHRTRSRWASMGSPTGGDAVSLCCTCPEVTLGGRYPLSLPCGARTFLTRGLSASARGCPTQSRLYFTVFQLDCQTSCKMILERIYYNRMDMDSLFDWRS